MALVHQAKPLGGGGVLKRTTLPNSTKTDIKLYTNNWRNLTDENFAVECNAASTSSWSGGYGYAWNGPKLGAGTTYSYDATTGFLSIALGSQTGVAQQPSSESAGKVQTTLSLSLKAVYMYE